MSVRFENVSFRYPGGTGGVFDIDLEIATGELLAVIGPSGSGKSTLLKLLSGFAVPDTGRILVDGRDVTRLPPHERALGVVFQSYALFPHMSLWRNVAYPLKVRKIAKKERRARALDALARVGLADFAERAPPSLSGGQQQRVALARALVFSPRALLLDEPLSALDASLRNDLRDEIVRVQRGAGIATLHVTHDQEEALSMGDRVAVMHAGRLVQVAKPRELYDRPLNRTVAAFVGHANLWPGVVEAAGRVGTPLGLLACDTTGFANGAQVTVLARPEAVQPLAELPNASRPNVFYGLVNADRFLGAQRRCDLEVGSGIVRIETTIRTAIHAVSIPPEAIRLLPPDSTASQNPAHTGKPS
ncbi:ABC transporter ATP-binding protein [Azorhizobium oxalatiphilum]|uniref:ABC transporter ATP-binding protein n=1 Tax=Azorhizobium oxalatiphilum TaxID=980631 RepID=A0A917FE63_9HYPH|nr:ABC transporter ATP-binding protein [Azorhizobium oxalatiphilum]GGF70755.1 ABC transporter ATP-binding protein [Azorhizobium oxalatiphilum]